MKSRLAVLLTMLMLMIGCASEDMQRLQQENKALQQQVADANKQISQLKQTEAQLRDTIGELRHTTSVLTTEKSSRVEESSGLRSQVRKFVQDNIDNLKAFMIKGNILDYVGSELVPRSKLDKGPLFIVDFANPMPSAGVLTGVGGNFTGAGKLYVKVLHPVGGQHVVTWESRAIEISAAGRQQIQFPVAVGVERGDVIGYFFPQAPNVGYDMSTGETLYNNSDTALGSTVSKTFMSGSNEKRAYSLGVYGLLDANN